MADNIWKLQGPSGATIEFQDNSGALEMFFDGTKILDTQGASITDAAAATAAALTDSTGGTADQTVADVGASFSQATLNNNFADVTDEINKLITDVASIRTAVNAIISRLEAHGLIATV